jgi:hypothetical protein
MEIAMPRSARDARRRPAWEFVALGAAALFLGSGIFLAPAAEARGFVGFSLGVPLGGPAYPAYYPSPYYYAPPPPVYYAPPPVAYAPPPVAYAPAPAYAPSGPSQDNCREYQSSATIDGRPQPTHGVACRQPDGSWRIVQ